MSNFLTVLPALGPVIHGSLTTEEKSRPTILRVNEVFYSIQGEGSRAGEPCIFIRLTGCGLRCTYCDTEYAFYEGYDTSLSSLLDAIKTFDCKLVELTGGEPLEQEAVFALMTALCDLGYEVMVETGGHVSISRVDPRVKRIVDLKTPSSGMMKRNLAENIEQLKMSDELKFVIGDRADFEWSKEQLELFKLPSKVGTILFSPVAGQLELQDIAQWILEDQLPVRLQIQLHKLIWPEVLRGV